MIPLTALPITGSLIILIIFGLSGVALFQTLRHLRRYRRERGCLRNVRMELRRSQSSTESDPATAERRPDGDGPSEEPDPIKAGSMTLLEQLQGPARSGELVPERLATIRLLWERRVRIDVNLLQSLTRSRDEARSGLQLSGYSAGSVMLLGVFGTFIGLSGMVRQLGAALPDAGADAAYIGESLARLEQVLGGMQTAFTTSIVGMFCAIVLGYCHHTLQRRRERFLQELDRFTAQELLPVVAPRFQDEDLLERVTFQLERSFDRLEEIQGHNRRVLAELTGSHQACAAIVEEVRAITHNEAARNLDQVLDALSRTQELLVELAARLPGILSSNEQSQRLMVQRLAEAVAGRPAPIWARVAPRELFIGLVGLLVMWVTLSRLFS